MSGKTNVLLNLIKNPRPDIDKIYLYVKDPFESKYQLLINGREKKVGIQNLKKFKSIHFFIHKQMMVFMKIWKIIIQKRRVLIVFDYMTIDIESNKNLNLIVTKLFLRGRTFNISFAFISQSYFKVPKTVRLNSTQRELQQIVLNHSSKEYTKELYSFLVNATIS